jgi:hypothetical protein
MRLCLGFQLAPEKQSIWRLPAERSIEWLRIPPDVGDDDTLVTTPKTCSYQQFHRLAGYQQSNNPVGLAQNSAGCILYPIWVPNHST